jgi:outer membrane protein assembly factor BamB
MSARKRNISTCLMSALAVTCLLFNNAALGQSAAASTLAPNGRKQTLKAHKPPGPPPRSRLRPPHTALGFAEAHPKQYSGSPIDVLTYHYDNRRTGWNPGEKDLTPKSIVSPQFGLLRTLAVDGNVFAQPLLLSKFRTLDGLDHNLLVVVTGHNTVYAFDADTYSVVWQVNLGPAQQSADVGCGDVLPEYGISSTPVIIRKSKDMATLYVVAAIEPTQYDFHTFIHALDLATGKDIVPPKELAPSDTLKNGSKLSFNPQNQWSRAGLAYSNGNIFVGIGSHCDNVHAKLSGWLLKYSESLELTGSFHSISAPVDYGLSSIWMTGFAPAIDDYGNLFVVTGNGDFNPPYSYGQSVLKLDGNTLGVLDYFTPSNYPSLNGGNDKDFGSGGVILLGRTVGAKKDLATAIGKDPVLYLLDRAALGKLQTGNTGALQSLLVHPGSGVWGGPAEFETQEGLRLFVQTGHDVLRALQMKTGATPTFTASSMVGTTKAGYGGSIPIVTSDGADNAVVWLLRRSEPIELEAYDANTLGTPLRSSLVGGWSNPSYGNSFLTPMVANGRVYAGAYKVVQVFGLTDQ